MRQRLFGEVEGYKEAEHCGPVGSSFLKFTRFCCLSIHLLSGPILEEEDNDTRLMAASRKSPVLPCLNLFLDIDECRYGYCQQLCANVPGS